MTNATLYNKNMEKEELLKLLNTTINVYADESSHTNDGSTTMVLGATWMDSDMAQLLSGKTKLIKMRHDISTHREIKWTKVSNQKLDYYKELVDLFIDTDGLNFRAVVVDKTRLDHERFGQTSDDFYYKMQYYLIRNIAEKCLGKIKIYLDYKDTWSGKRCHKLAEYLSSTNKLHSQAISAQPVRSHEAVAIQLADLISGAVMYANKERSEGDSTAKLDLVRYIEQKTGQSLKKETPYSVEKFNLFFWEPR